MMTQPVLETIIQRLQFCIVDARSLQLKMLEQVLSMAALQALEDKENFENNSKSKRL
jgi:hypothetical protein